MNSPFYRIVIFLCIGTLVFSSCSPNLWGSNAPTLAPTPTTISIETITAGPELTPTPTELFIPSSTTHAVTPLPSPTPTRTPEVVISSTQRPVIFYTSQSGDSLEAITLHFGVSVSDLVSPVSLPTTGLLNPDTALFIPNLLSQVNTTPTEKIIPDSEVVYSPSAQSFDIEAYINSTGGNLSTFREPRSNGMVTAAEGIQILAFGSSINPRLLLTIIQYYTGWVQGQPAPNVDLTYPLGYHDPAYPGLYQQLRLIIRELVAGYYGWRDGTLTSLTFPDGTTLRLAPDLNAGTVSLQYMFSRHLNQAEWLQTLDVDSGFPALFSNMFGDPWQRAELTGPLFPPDLAQPVFTLPFEVGTLWAFTGGPHPAWEQQSAYAALDFAPAADDSGCVESTAWVAAIASGQIVRSADAYVVLDLDGDGFEQTGWVVLYYHIATKNRVPEGVWVTAGDHIGHPSCEGGEATGTHVHIARKYNGEWVSAGDPLPFVMSGWTTQAGVAPYKGTLTKGSQTITANQSGVHESQIIRQAGE